MKVLFSLFVLCIQSIPLLAGSSYSLLKVEVYQLSYNVYINQWFKKKTSDILVSKVLINEDIYEGKIIFENKSNTVVYFGLDDLDCYKILDNGKFSRLLFDIEHTSLIYEAKVNDEAYIPFSLKKDFIGKILVRAKIKSLGHFKYYINIFLEAK